MWIGGSHVPADTSHNFFPPEVLKWWPKYAVIWINIKWKGAILRLVSEKVLSKSPLRQLSLQFCFLTQSQILIENHFDGSIFNNCLLIVDGTVSRTPERGKGFIQLSSMDLTWVTKLHFASRPETFVGSVVYSPLELWTWNFCSSLVSFLAWHEHIATKDYYTFEVPWRVK